MLIDLERNDLGRVCEAGSVHVDEFMTIESYAHVHHIVSNVRGRLRADVTPGEVLAAVFPGGTITGCPKVRCMEIIAELEGTPRGAYTGSLGYLNRDGSMDMNILIRSLEVRGRELTLRAGAGIVADSIPERELEETRAKARGVLRALARRRRMTRACSSTVPAIARPAARDPRQRSRPALRRRCVRNRVAARTVRSAFSRHHLRSSAARVASGSASPARTTALREDIQRVVTRIAGSGVLKIIVTRGAGGRGYRPEPALAVDADRRAVPVRRREASSGIALRWCETASRAQRRLAGIKHLNRLEQVLAQTRVGRRARLTKG